MVRHMRSEEALANAIKGQAVAIRAANTATGTEKAQTAATVLEMVPVVADALEQAQQAIEDAANALTTSSGKNSRRRGESEPSPPPGGWVQGDQWIVDNADGVPVEVRVWDGAAFQPEQLLASELLVLSGGLIRLADGVVTADAIAADAIDGMVITGALIRTAASGQRLELDLSGLRSFNAAGAVTGSMFAGTGGLQVSGTFVAADIQSHGAGRSSFFGAGGMSTVMADNSASAGMEVTNTWAHVGASAGSVGNGADLFALADKSTLDLVHGSNEVTIQAIDGAPAKLWFPGQMDVGSSPGQVFNMLATPKVMGKPLPGTMLARGEKVGSTTGATAGSTLVNITGGAALTVSVTVAVATDVVIMARTNMYGSGGALQLGTNLSGATVFDIPVDHSSIGKGPPGADMMIETKLFATLNPGTTSMTLAWRGTSANSIRNPIITVQAV